MRETCQRRKNEKRNCLNKKARKESDGIAEKLDSEAQQIEDCIIDTVVESRKTVRKLAQEVEDTVNENINEILENDGKPLKKDDGETLGEKVAHKVDATTKKLIDVVEDSRDRVPQLSQMSSNHGNKEIDTAIDSVTEKEDDLEIKKRPKRNFILDTDDNVESQTGEDKDFVG